MITIAAWKGVTYTIKFGVSLEFVPHIDYRGNIAWHRTAKSVFAENSIMTSISWMGLNVLQPLELFAQDVAFVVPRAVRMSEIYLADVVDAETALAFLDRAGRQFGPNKKRVWIDYGQVDLARIFLEAHLGKTDEAMARLEAWCEAQSNLRDLEPRSAERLRKLVADAGATTMS
ncbi:hypothetical protein [Jannaschia aquimarina]|uniref:Uncharacterized protein n=1 Tax=Jannaschia aquimarina TaxID=935700 RepID=A0A0D1EIL2_9RHOB|nr:hypothetical protein [Jannaschia aquimarina]KIT16751.1 hypothetical protein jaqu_15390 [Jannaschia aquimarina]SNS53233.1 hypothetical protein SAMN05421775_101339 [Jannaschia aquimarina]